MQDRIAKKPRDDKGTGNVPSVAPIQAGDAQD